MKKRHVAITLFTALAAALGIAAYAVSPTIHPGKNGEAPELGRTGPYKIGTAVETFVLKSRGHITAKSAVTGSLEPYDRIVSVRFWYPANPGVTGAVASYEHSMPIFGKQPLRLVSQGIAITGAPPLARTRDGRAFPLVVMSHGYGGWNTQFSNLGEHIASHGYIIASIDHGDAVPDGIASALLSFSNVLVDRTLDQRQVLAQILARANTAADKSALPFLSRIDATRIGLIGYSMGGYGALSTAGAAYDFSRDPLGKIPEGARTALQDAARQQPPISALITFAPWGGQPESRAWTAAALAKITIPTLVVSGNQDDVTNFREGVSWIYDALGGADRYMLVYREARHNIVGNPFNLGPDENFAGYEFLNEPVWRSDRLNSINQHFVTAFLDLTLKNDTAKRAYLDVPYVDANKGEWPTSFGEQLNGTVAGPKQDKYWRGFQRRWAAGIELHHKPAGSTPAK